jgi:Ca-activated chloride channel family protein
MLKTALPVAALGLLAGALFTTVPTVDAARIPPGARPGDVTEGSLIRVDPYSKNTGELCPLRHTSVEAEISGQLARVNVTQEFVNPTQDKIEAVYKFPLPPMSAVDQMMMTIGDRKIKAVIKKRDEARKIFEDARNRGNTAALLEQQRPNVFTQSVTNIEPGAKVLISISYVETLKYEEGGYEFSFPMTVGPRYIPLHARQTAVVNPKYAPPATRAGHDLSMKVSIDAGVPVRSIRSTSHEIDSAETGAGKATVALRAKAVIPNKDFILRYDVAGATVSDAVLTHHPKEGKDGWFTLILQPPKRVTVEDVTPKELVFVLDTSGSMSGFPIEKAKETMKLALEGLYPRDTFNLITFAGDTHILFPQPVPATRENLDRAQAFLAGRSGGGGTEMMKAIRAALAPSGSRDSVRIVCFMTDGFVGNDMEIIEEVKRYAGARVFSFGIGSSVNRFLLDKMAEAGRGEVEYVSLDDDGSEAARRFHERVRNPLLTDVWVDWHGLPVTDIYPKRISDLFSAKPLIIHGRYTWNRGGKITIHGRMSGKPWSRDVALNLPEYEPRHDVLATLWARTKIDDLMNREMGAFQNGAVSKEIEDEITSLGLRHRLMTQFTSFVAVEEKTVTRGGKPVVIEVPSEMPDGVSHQGVFGDVAAREMAFAPNSMVKTAVAQPTFQVGSGGRADESRVRGNFPVALPRTMPLPREEKKDRRESAVLDAALQNLLAASADKSAEVTVEVWLNDAAPELLAQLKAAGFAELREPRVAKIRTGKIRLSQLEALSRIAGVTHVRLVRGQV